MAKGSQPSIYKYPYQFNQMQYIWMERHWIDVLAKNYATVKVLLVEAQELDIQMGSNIQS